MEFKNLKRVIQSDEQKLFKTADKLLKKQGYETVQGHDFTYLYAEGSIPVLLIAHTDTVHKTAPNKVFFDPKEQVMWSPDGLGADDRAGVFAVLELAKQFDIGVLLCTGEESGGIGAHQFIADYPFNPKYKLLIELDRRGENDCVFYSNNNFNFHKYIEGFGFKKAFGSFSDISVIAPQWRANAVNLSVGYEEEHMDTEHLYLEKLRDTMNKVRQILISDIPEFEYREYTRVYNYSKKTSGFGRYGYYEDFYDYHFDYCDLCGKYVLSERLEETDSYDYLCQTCAKIYCERCEICGTYFFTSGRVEGGDVSKICEGCWEDVKMGQTSLTVYEGGGKIGENRSDEEYDHDEFAGGWSD